MIDRSTCPRPQADECELLYVAELGTRELRADYLDRSERFDGKAHADALRDRVSKTWHDWRASGTPLPCKCEAARGGCASPHLPNEAVGAAKRFALTTQVR